MFHHTDIAKRLFAAFLMAAAVSVSGLNAQEKVQTGGRVLDSATSEPLVGATVVELGTYNAVLTDTDGSFTITTASDAVLNFSYLMYKEQNIPVRGGQELRVLLEADLNQIEETVVVGYGTQRAKDLTAPIASVRGSELSKQISANPMSALQGMVSGVQIVQSGTPGTGPTVKVRGVGSIGDYANPLYVVDGVFVDNIDFLSNGDIESLTVLKDASAAAIYGVRAANGVILVTTRKGTCGRTNISYDGYAGVQVPTNIMKLANAEQYVELLNLANANNEKWTPLSVSDYRGDTDWYAALVRPAMTHNHSIDLSGANDRTNWSVGMNYYYQNGIMNYSTNDYRRLNFRVRLDQELNSWFKVGVNSVLSRYWKNNPNSGAYFQAYVNPPVYGIYNDSNTSAFPESFDSPQLYGFGNSYGNPVANAYYYDNTDNGLKEVFSAYAEFTIVPERLKFKTSYNLDFTNWDQRSYTPAYFVGGSQGNGTSSFTKTFGYGMNQIIDNVLTWTDTRDRHRYSIMLGQSTRMNYSTWLNGTAQNVPDYDDQSKYLVNGSYKNQRTSDGASRYNGLSAFARGTYNYDDRYLATLTFRADASSKYQEKWGFFPSVGLAWNITGEDFMASQSAFQNLKLRASWGMLGNDNVPSNSMVTVGTSGVGSSGVFGETLVDGVGSQTVYQNWLRWEIVNETNVGAEFAAVGGRLTGDIDWYWRVTSNVVFNAPIATGGGTSYLLANNGKVRNTGVELSLNWAESLSSGFSYNIGINATTNFNKVLELNGRDYIPGGYVRGNYSTKTQVGYPIGAFWGYKIDSVYASESEALKDPLSQAIKDAGYFKYSDIDGNGVIDENDKTYLGSPIPWFTLGLNFGFSYKGFDFSMLLAAQVGNKILNAKRMNRDVFVDGNYDLDFYKNAWRSDAKSKKYPSPEAYNSSFIQQANTFFVEDGSYFRIQNIQAGYTFRKIKGMKNLRVYLSAQRPLTIFGYNGYTTEIGGSPIESGIDNSVYPMQAIYTLGLNLNF